jgi:hypothetical protein
MRGLRSRLLVAGDAIRRFAAFVATTMLVVNCASSDEMGGTTARSPGPSRSAATAIAVTPSPRWISEYCAEAARVIEPPVLCPARAPKGILPTENLDVLRPSAEGYVFEGDAETHWVFGASPGDVEGDYGAMRHLSAATVRGTRGRWLYAPESAGIHAGHLVLEWRVGMFHYAVSAHTDDPSSDQLRQELRTVAEGMRLYP